MGHFFVEFLQQALGVFFLECLVVVATFAPGLVGPLLVPLEGPGGDDFDGGAPGVTFREAGILGRGELNIGQWNIVVIRVGQKLLNLLLVIGAGVNPEIGLR